MSAPEFTTAELANRWPQIHQFLSSSSGSVADDFLRFGVTEDQLTPSDRAAAYEEWADFYEWRLTQRAAGLTRVQRHLAAEWTDSMTYLCRRSAATARGEDPGAWTSQSARRPDLDVERQAIVAEIVASLSAPAAIAG